MTLEEAIKHAEKVAEKLDVLCEISVTERAKISNKKCAKEHRQLAGWLRLLQRILASGDCNDCAMLHSQCRYAPKWGEQVRYNCPFHSRESEESE